MADRDVKVTYKTREIPEGQRPRIPTALDPHDISEDGRKWRESRPWREQGRNSPASSTSTVAIPRSSKTTYSSSDRREARESFVEIDQEYERQNSRRRQQEYYPRSARDSGNLADEGYRRAGSRDREYVIDKNVRGSDESFRRDGDAYIMDARGKVDIIMPGRDRDRTYGGREAEYASRDRAPRSRAHVNEQDYREGDTLPGGVVVVRRDITPPSRSQRKYTYDIGSPSPQPGRRDYDRDDDWRIIDSMRDTRISSAELDDRSRARAATQSSEDSFVMVTPTQGTTTSVRSALQRKDYPPGELRRRRSRSISFRDSETVSHDVGDRRHERPGTEANILGHHLKRRSDRDVDIDVDVRDYEVREPRRGSRRTQGSEPEAYVYARDDRYPEPYPPQNDYSSARRDRSRRRRRTDDDDDRSYYSEHVDKKYVKTTRYI